MAMIRVGDNVYNESEGVKNYEQSRKLASDSQQETMALFDQFPDEEQPSTQAPREETDEGSSFAENVTGAFGAVGHGIIKAGQEVGNLAIETSNGINQWFVDNGMPELSGRTDRELLTFADNPEYVYQPDGTAEGIISGISNFLAPMGAVSKGAKGIKVASKLGKFAKAGALGAMVDFAAFDPEEARLSDLIEKNPHLSNWATTLLASNPKDTRLEGRMKNAVEGILLGMVTEGAIEGIPKVAELLTDTVKTYRARRVVENVKIDAENAVKEMEKRGIPVPEGEEIGEEVVKQIDEVKAEVKSKRPTQQPLEEQMAFDFKETKVEVDGKSMNATDAVDPKEMLFYAKGKLDNFDDLVFKAKRGVLSVDDTKALAESIGENPEKFTERMLGDVANAEQMLAGATTLRGRYDELHKLALLDEAGKLTDLQKVQYMNLMDETRVMKVGWSATGSEVARSLAILRQANSELGTAAMRRKMDDVLKRGGSMKQMSKGIISAYKQGGTAGVSKALKRSWGRKFKDAFMESYVNGLLSGSKTHVMNMASNGLTAVAGIAESAIAEGSSRIANAYEKGSLSGLSQGSIDSVAAGETIARANGMINSIGDAFRMAKDNFKSGESFFKNSKAYTRDFENAISAKGFDLDEGSVAGKFMDGLGKFLGLPTKALEASDEFFKAVNYRAEVYAQAHRKANMKKVAEGLSDSDAEKLFKELIENPDESIKIEALGAAQEKTFTKPLENVELRGFGAEQLDDLIKSSPMLKVVTPFTKTSLNLVEYALNRTPFAKGLLGDLKAGGVRRDTALARVTFGMGTMTFTMSQAFQGNVTGRGPTDQKARKLLEQSGWKPYSIKVGDEYYQYNKLEPWGALMSSAADMAEIFSSLSSEREIEAQELLIQSGAVMANLFTPEFVSRNMNDFIDALNGDKRKAENFIGGFARGAVPYSSALREARKQIDPVQRERMADKNNEWAVFERALNEIKDTIPGLSSTLPPKRDMFGDVKTFVAFRDNPDNEGPFDDNAPKKDPIKDEIRRLNSMSADNNHLKIDMPEKYMRKTLGGESVSVKFTPEEYDRYVQLSAGIDLQNSPFEGMTLRDALNEQVVNDYPALDGAPKNDETKMLILKEIVSAYRKAAKEQLLFESSDMEERFIQGFEKRSQELSGNGFGGSL